MLNQKRIGQMFDLVNLKTGSAGAFLAAPVFRDDGAGEAQLGGFLEPSIGMGDGAHLAGQADFTEHHRFRRYRHAAQTGRQRRRDGQVGRRFTDPQATGDVQVDIVGADGQAAAGFQYSQHHRL